MAEALRADAYRDEQEAEFQASTLKRSSEQERARVQRARMKRRERGGYAPGAVAAAANDNEEASPTGESPEAEEALRDQERVQRLRYAKTQVVLASQEEAAHQLERAEREQPKIIRYLPAGAVAVLDDLSDLILIGSIPVIGTIMSFFCNVIIFILLSFAKEDSSFEEMRFVVRRLLIILVCFLIEGFIVGVNFFPFETVTVIIIYLMDKHVSKQKITDIKKFALPLLGKKSL